MLALTVYSSFVQNEIEGLSQDTKIGIRFAFQPGTSKHLSRSCYEYRRKNGRLIIDRNILKEFSAYAKKRPRMEQ